MTQSNQHESAAPPLNSDQQTALLQMARDAITTYVTHGRTPQYQSDDPALLQLAGVFVTLRTKTKGDDMPLRGRIGLVVYQTNIDE
jgi:AMMECR1 domain-containing protein